MSSFVSSLTKYFAGVRYARVAFVSVAAAVALGAPGCMQLEIMNSGGSAVTSSGATSTPFLGGRWIDSAGNFVIADSGNNVVRKVSASNGRIATTAGAADPLMHLTLAVNGNGIALDSSNNLYIPDPDDAVVYKFDVTTGALSIVAGTLGSPGYSGDGGAAPSAQLDWPVTIAFDGANDLYIGDAGNNLIRKVDATTGIITTVAGIPASSGYSGDGGPATSAELDGAVGMAFDNSGDLYIADTGNQIVRRVDATTGIITTVAGTPTTAGYFGDGGAATSSQLTDPVAVAFDSSNNLYIADTENGVVREVTAGIITTVAGDYTQSYSNTGIGDSGDGGAATAAGMYEPCGLALDSSNDLYVTDCGAEVIREVNSTTGIISTVAGNYSLGVGYSGDGGLATSAQLSQPSGIAIRGSGPFYFVDRGNAAIREVNTATGIISTVLGNDYTGYSGDGGASTNAKLNGPAGIAWDRSANVYVADTNNNVIRKVDATTGTITTVAGNYTLGAGYGGDGGVATSAQLDGPAGLALDSAGNLYIADSINNVVRRLDAVTGIITTVAGNNTLGGGYSGDGLAATGAQLQGPSGVALDSSNNLYIADAYNCVIRRVDALTGIITTAAGGGQSCGYSGDGSAAGSAQLDQPADVVVDSQNNIYIADAANDVIRRVDATTGIITTIAGDQSLGGTYAGDGGAAAEAGLGRPVAVALDARGNLYIGDTSNNVVRKVDAATGIITTVAGDNSLGAGFSGDGGAATSAQLNSPY